MPSVTKISLAISLIGIIILLILTNTIPPKKLEIVQITDEHLNKKVETTGTITKIQNHKNFQILTITKDSFSMDVLLDKKINLTKDQSIKVIGKLETYKDRLQIRAERLSLIPKTNHSVS